VVENPEYPSLQGGFIFDWMDQSIQVGEGKDAYFTYGGKGFGLTRDANFQSCGLVNPDRTPHPAVWEVKKVYQNVDVEPINLSEGQIRIHNEHFFKDLSEYTLQWTIEANGNSISSGTIANVDVPARSSDDTSLQYEAPSPEPGTEYFLTVRAVLADSTRWAPAGHEVAFDQFRLPSSRSRSPLTVDLSNRPSLSVEQSPTKITVTGADFEATFDRLKGTLSSFVHGGTELVAEGPIFNAWRPITDNDQSDWGIGSHYTSKWYDARLPDLAHRVLGVTAERVSPRHVRVVIHAEMTEPGNALSVFDVSYYYNVLANGEIVLGHTAAPTYDFEDVGLPRLGLQMEVPATQQTFTWFGKGPHETYRDRNTGARVDRYQAPVSEQYFPYVRPQATGNKTDVRWASLTNRQGMGLHVMPGPASLDSASGISVFPDTTSLSNLMGGPFEVSALPYTTENIDQALYKDELVTHGNVVLNIDRLQAGAGNMPQFRLREYEVPPKPVQYVVIFRPLESGRNRFGE
jgi:beta-galactosidase